MLFVLRVREQAQLLARDGVCALAALFDLTGARLVRYALTLTRNLHDAEDAVQSGLMQLSANPKGLAKADHPWAYLVRVIRNEALKLIDRRLNGRPLDASPEPADDGHSESGMEEQRRLVRQALEKLPREQSEVVILKMWEELTFAEIADVLGESPNTVASRYRYALEKLSRQLSGDAD